MNEQVRALIEGVRNDPDARDELLRALLSDRFLDLPARVDAIEATLQELIQAQLRTQEQLDALTRRVDALTERVDALTEQVQALVEAQARTGLMVEALSDRLDRQLPRIDMAAGYVVERRYTERAGAYFAPIARRIRVLSQDALDDLLERALEDGKLSADETVSLRLADTIASGSRQGEPVHLVVEASYTVDAYDVQRSVSRAGLLGRVVGATIPVVAGQHIDSAVRRIAQGHGVWQVLDGTVTDPEGRVVKLSEGT